MGKTLAELQSSPDVGPLERTAYVCVAGKLVDEFDRISDELVETQAEIEQTREKLREEAEQRRDGGGPPRRSGQKSKLPELEEKAERLAAEADEYRDKVMDNSVAVRLRVDEGKWRQFVAAHPARDEQTGKDEQRRLVDPAGYAEDAQWARGLCNVAALVAELREWIVAYNDEPTSDAWWEFLRRNGVPGDMTKAASTVVGMHVKGVDPGKSRRAWLDSHRSASDSE